MPASIEVYKETERKKCNFTFYSVLFIQLFFPKNHYQYSVVTCASISGGTWVSKSFLQ